jgi:hypothetical protein
MNYKMRVVIIALIPLLIVTVSVYLDTPPGGHLIELGYMLIMCIAVVVEAMVLLALSLIVGKRKPESAVGEARDIEVANNRMKSQAILFAAAVVLLVGGSLCFGGAELLK